jgi:hypothetical protein
VCVCVSRQGSGRRALARVCLICECDSHLGLFGCVYARGTCGYRQRNMGGGSRIESRVFFLSSCMCMRSRCVFLCFVGWAWLATHARKHTRIATDEEKRN